uniref:Transcription elongation factor spt6 n=1 Tax=Kalanchoe fedtschenkoi TaxID=63787 RepID=A0A7N0ZV00_KALFE
MARNNDLSDDEYENEVDDEREPEGEEVEERDEDDEEEEDDEGQDEYEKDGFIVDDVDEEEEDHDGEEERADSDEEKQKKKKRKKRESEKNFLLDEDDYELLEDNNITGFHRPKESKKFKRLKKAQRDNDDGQSGFSDEEFGGSGKGGRTAEEKLKRSLFGDDDAPLEDLAEEEEQPEEDGDLGEEDEMADFIVDEEEIDEHGAPVRRRKPVRKRSRQAPGVSSYALQEAHEIFGDVDELLQLRKQGLDAGEWKERRLEDEFEPLVLSEKYMTEKDDRIREIDIPERMQISEESTGPPPTDEGSRAAESNWIYGQLMVATMPLLNKSVEDRVGREAILREVARFLELTHVQKLDVPFIAMYRKEDIPTLLKDVDQWEGDYDNVDDERQSKMRWHKLLWAIQDLDRKWLLLQKRKAALELYYQKRFDEEQIRLEDIHRIALNKELFRSIQNSLGAAESEREVDDVDIKFNLHFPPGEVILDEGQFKRPKRRSQYSICSKAGLWVVASKFGYTSERFGLQISLQIMRTDALADPKETPEEVASNFTCAMFSTPQDVLKGARHMASMEISCEPCVRKHIRSIFMEKAVVSTTPTSEGNASIDAFHQFASVKWLREKPLTKFNDVQWLLIQKAEEEKLLQVTIKLRQDDLDKLVSDAHDHYLSDGVSRSAQQWNEQRKQILHDAIFNHLLPLMEKEARSLLAIRAKNWVLSDYGRVLWEKVSVAPYQRKENDVSNDEEAAPRVMACCWGPGKPATTFVMLDSSGEVLDVLYTGSLTLRSQNVNDQQRKKNDQQRVLKFMTDHQPQVVVLGAVNLSCTRLKDDIYEIIFKMVEENPRDVGHEMDGLTVVYGDESLPHLYENSRISNDQLPGQPGIVKRAVALGRYLQNPLAVVATVCGPGREVLSWKLTSSESFLNPDEKYEMIEQIMIDATNQVGLDVNLAASHEWLFAPLQFISGLGPRKAASLQRSLVRTGAIFTRKDFLTAHGLEKKVFVNAVGFLRVRRSGLAASSSQYIDLLDDTRIHPESYTLAQEVAKEVYKHDVQDDLNDDEDILEIAIEHVRERPNLVKSFDVQAYARDTNRKNKIQTFNDIKMELINGFRDWRKQHTEPSADEEFYMISGETEDTLCEGRIVQVKVRKVQAHRAFCTLESGLTGVLNKEDYADGRDVELSDLINEDDILTCKVKGIQKNRYQVFLSCRESDLRADRNQYLGELDPYYREDKSCLQIEQDKARKEKELAKKNFKPRNIKHPRFANITADEAMQLLANKDPGESIIRPSSRGPSYLTLTLKVYDGVYAHKDIVEGGKEHRDITSLLGIGKTLKIGEDTFEDLDELWDRYVDPLVSHLKAMLSYRKFKAGTKSEVDELLKNEKADNPMRIVYSFGIYHEHPGTFILTYIRSSTPHHEYIGLYPKGFKFRKRMFEDLDRLVAYFQRHIDDPQIDSAPSIRSVAAMVPMRSPAPGSSAGSGWGGTGNDGGWGGQSFDRERSSTPASRTGRNDNRNGGSHDGLPPRYDGGGRGRGRGRGRGGRGGDNNDRSDSGYGTPKWDSKDGGDGGSWGSFPGAKVQESPGKESFPGGWGGSSSGAGGWGSSNTHTGGGNSNGSGGGWGSSPAANNNGGGSSTGGWGGTPKTNSAQAGGGSGW